MTNTKDIIIKLKEVREEKGLSINNILDMVEEAEAYPPSRSTIQRLFAEGSENNSFKYEETIRPIARVLLDIENIEEDDDMDIKAMKSLLKYKMQRIEELERTNSDLQAALTKEKLKYHEKLDKEREQYRKSIEFLKNQISLKDKRMDQLLEAVFVKDQKHDELLKLILSCPARQKMNCEDLL